MAARSHPGLNRGEGSPNLHVPRIVSWNTTFKCNLRCAHCYMDAQERSSRSELSTEEGMKLLDQLAELSKPVVVLSGGEPLLRHDIYELAEHGTSLGLKMAMGTNGTLIDDAVAERLYGSGVKSVAVSLDSATPEIHDEFRGVKGSWAKAVEGAKACMEAGIAVRFNTTVTHQNFHEIGEILSLAEGMGLKDVQLFFLVPTGRGKSVEDITPRMYEDMIEKVLRDYAGSGLTVKPTCAPQFMRIADQIGVDTSRWTRGCIAGLSYCRVYPEGEVTPCPYLPIKLGNVREIPFKEIWEGSDILRALRDFDQLKGKCRICDYRASCGGCRARAYGLSSDFIDACGALHEPHELAGDFLGEEPWCTYQPGHDSNSTTLDGGENE